MQKLLVATTNKGKIHELREFLKDLKVQLVSLKDVGIEVDVEEDGKTYIENSQKKALFYAKLSGLPAVADDGGLEIAFLNGEPGVRSRRWLGYHGTDAELIEHLKKVVASIPNNKRQAVFRTVVSFALPTGEIWSQEGLVSGVLSEEPEKALLEGYPYRSFFYLPEIKKFYHESELTPEEMKEYNHRYKAIEKLKPIIKKELHV